jgi:flagellum-specific peptidoglycan hydrolase FlgJ
MRKGYLLILILVTVSLNSCGSSKKTASNKSNSKKQAAENTVSEKEISKKTKIRNVSKNEQLLFVESDKVFKDFKKRNGAKLNSFTVDYIGKYKNIAIKKMVEYKIPASITLAQGILESGNGLSTLARKSNNHFGIKCHSNWKGKKVYHDDDRKQECFRKYKNPEGSFDDHSKFLTTRGRYTFLFDLKPGDYKAWAKGLKKAGYATDRKYPSKLISFIENFDLDAYDDLVIHQKRIKKDRRRQERKDAIVDTFIIVSKGDTLYSIARNNNTTVENLKKRNNLISNEISIGQKLFLSK